jgi:hypothetical protein
MGDYYVKVVIFRHTEFEEAPVIPLIFMIHMKRIEFIQFSIFTGCGTRSGNNGV